MTRSHRSGSAISLQDTSIQSQRARILDALEGEPSGKSTIDLRENHGVMSPAPRVLELRRMGHKIETVYVERFTPDGVRHRSVALYVLRQKSALTATV